MKLLSFAVMAYQQSEYQITTDNPSYKIPTHSRTTREIVSMTSHHYVLEYEI
jgi:hypothetical protein